MPKISPISGKILVKVFQADGFVVARQSGSHVMLKKPGVGRPIVVPQHKAVQVSVILSNLRTARMSRSTYFELLEKVR
ncbi:MAG: type II toxin-antitoxin system HicA family toxin [Chloroflexi bacterium]|nr:type II toxin-antitoxin system HicA family toxin [Chloroflexota bacterium]MCY4106181.1 type II toxin-antitoxin system HicA family toxin [Chloroflexota bacterium]